MPRPDIRQTAESPPTKIRAHPCTRRTTSAYCAEFHTPGQGVLHPPMKKQRGRARRNDLQRCPCSRILVPELLPDISPVLDLLHLVNREWRFAGTVLGQKPGTTPFRSKPLRRAQLRIIRSDRTIRKRDMSKRLPDGCRFSCLSRPRQHLDESARLLSSRSKLRNNGTFKDGLPFVELMTQRTELIVSPPHIAW